MAHLSIEGGRGDAVAEGLRARLGALTAGLAARFEAYLERQGRIGELQRLNAMSDKDLARLGVSRERIVQYVFRDKLGF